MTEAAALRPKTYIYLTDSNDEGKKQKMQKGVSKHFLDLTQIENKTNHLEKNKIDVSSMKKRS